MTNMNMPAAQRYEAGFTLIEMAVVLMIVGLLLGGVLATISGQVQQQRASETLKQLNDIQQALIGYAIIYGRLPCPAAPNTTGVESPPGGGSCSNFNNGFLPAATLGVSPTDSQGYAVDAWGNRIRYAVSSWSSGSPSVLNVFTTGAGMNTVGISNLYPNLYVCSTATGISGTACASGTTLTTNGVPAVVFSTGKNGGAGSAGSDEAANLDNNRTFVSHLPTPSSSANGEYDDLVVWMSTYTLLNRLVAAGKMP